MLLPRRVFVRLQRRVFRRNFWGYTTTTVISAVFFFWLGAGYKWHNVLFVWLKLPEIFRAAL